MDTFDIKTEINILKQYAKDENVPIIQDDGMEFLETFIEKKQIKNILEIGTAIGYSAIKMALVREDIHVTTIERDEERYLEALKNIKKLLIVSNNYTINNDSFMFNFYCFVVIASSFSFGKFSNVICRSYGFSCIL